MAGEQGDDGLGTSQWSGKKLLWPAGRPAGGAAVQAGLPAAPAERPRGAHHAACLRGGGRVSRSAVSSRRSIRLILVLALLLGVQTAYANPAVVAAELRALSCCARHCDGPVSLPSARSCCGLTATTSGPAEGPVAPGVPWLAAAIVTGPSSALAPAAPTWVPADTLLVTGSGPPVFLAHRHLLI